MPELNSKRLGVTYQPASSADADLIQSAINDGATTLPTYLIQVKPVIQLDGAPLATGSAMRMGEFQYWTMTLNDPISGRTSTENFTVTSGDEMVFSINGNGLAPEVVLKRQTKVSTDTASENLQQVAMHYWMEHEFFDYLAAKAHDVHMQRLPSAALVSAPLTVNYFFGIPRSGSYQSRQIDAKRVHLAAVGPTDNARRAFMRQAGIQGSYLEGSVFDQLFGRPQGTGQSAAQLLAEANRQAIPVYTLSQANLAFTLPHLALSAEMLSTIQSAISSDHTVTIAQRDVTHTGYTGVGYIVVDPQTGAGAYMLDGGLNGGAIVNCDPSVIPPAEGLALETTVLFALFKKPEQVLVEKSLKQRLMVMLAMTLIESPVLLLLADAVLISMTIIMVVHIVQMALAAGDIVTSESAEDRCENICRKKYKTYGLCGEMPINYLCEGPAVDDDENDIAKNNAIKAANEIMWDRLAKAGFPDEGTLRGESKDRAERGPPQCKDHDFHIELVRVPQIDHPASLVGCDCCNDTAKGPKLERRIGMTFKSEIFKTGPDAGKFNEKSKNEFIHWSIIQDTGACY